jgi:hypothetical protein
MMAAHQVQSPNTRKADGPAILGHSESVHNQGRQLRVVDSGSNAPRRTAAPQQRAGVTLTWQGAEYARVSPGAYEAVCVGWKGPDYCAQFHRYSLALKFQLLGEDKEVFLFLNMGKGGPPKRGSNFFKVWTAANGELPRKGQEMALEIFTEPGLVYTVQVEDAAKDAEGNEKPDALVYSRATRVLGVIRNA